MRLRNLVVPLALIALTSCSSAPDEVAATATPVETTPETYALTVDVIDVVPLQIATNNDDVECYPSAATVGANKKGAQFPQITVRDAAGTIVGTADVSVAGSWGEDRCSMPTFVGDVPASNFYTLTLVGDGGIFKIESHEFELTVEAEPVDGEIVVEWEL
ncbi:hypothetical protein [Brachybacterium muris]|uniref:Lipoprotein n=1 Tax=Brachybacterium muris UCD-AY4 TaxID=1249481 RepID=A0A022KZP9_9MICO|nr:hypothetical protein [Brachybacterium muris]EYT51279.1 hypothetical protein D641_0101585 [Brachybacterium muris UCD-AY4]